MRELRTLSTLSMMTAAALAVSALTSAPARADPQTPLEQAVIEIRAASACAPLEPDALVERVAAMANQSSSDYIEYRSAAVPFTDPLPALSAVGYSGTRAIQLSGYGTTQAEAVHAVMLQWQGTKPDCSFTQFGTSAWDDDAGYHLTSVILAQPTQ